MIRIGRFIRRHERLTILVAVLAAVGGVLLLLFAANAPAASGVEVLRCLEADGACIRFPSVTGTNLNGTAISLPQDFAGSVNLVVVSFEEDQTARAAAWLPLARELETQFPDYAFYNVPVLPSVNALLRGVIMGGMLVLIPDIDVREITVMLFLDDIDAFLTALAIPDRSAVQVFLVNGSGDVLWRAAGDYTDGSATELRRAVQAASR